MARMAQGDLGYSFSRGDPVATVLSRSLPPTLLLTALAFAASSPWASRWPCGWSAGGPPGRPAAARRGRRHHRHPGLSRGPPAHLCLRLPAAHLPARRHRLSGCLRAAGDHPRASRSHWCWHACCGHRSSSNRASRTSPLRPRWAKAPGRCVSAICCPTRSCRCSRCWRSISRGSSQRWRWWRSRSRCLGWAPTSCPAYDDSTRRSSSASASSPDCSWRWSTCSLTWPLSRRPARAALGGRQAQLRLGEVAGDRMPLPPLHQAGASSAQRACA